MKRDNNGNNALMILINNDMKLEAESLIYGLETEKIIKYLSDVNSNGDTPLLLACKKNMESLANLICSDVFIEQCINENYTYLDNVNSENETALMWACFYKFVNVVDMLIKNNLSYVDIVNNYGNTSLIICCSNAMSDQAITLLNTNLSKPEHVNNNGKTALMWACCNDLIEVVEKMLNYNCNINHIYNNSSALTISFKFKYYEISKILLTHKKDLIVSEDVKYLIDITEKFKNNFNFCGMIKKKKIIEQLNNTKYEYLIDIDELVKYKINLLGLDKHCCLICENFCDTPYYFNKCHHVVYYHDNCIKNTINCPMCRSNSKFIKCYVSN